jgi:hypothetical protein
VSDRPPPLADQIAAGTRRSQAAIGAIGIALVIAFSAFLLLHGGGRGGPGVRVGQPVRRFVAPLASSDLNAPANVNPRCNPSRPARRGLNVCGREPIALDLFTTGAPPCVRSVDALQRISALFPGVVFAAVALDSPKAAASAMARARGWRIPVAYDSDGAVAALYRVSVCPLIQLVDGHGTVVGRLIGKGWDDPARLAGAVGRLLAAH